jgi:hypothetical protein
MDFQIIGPPMRPDMKRYAEQQREQRERVEQRQLARALAETRSTRRVHHPCPTCQYPTTLSRCNWCREWEAIETRRGQTNGVELR